MNMDEAIGKYGIHVPTDLEFYSQEYKDFFEKRRRSPELTEKFSKYEEFNKMYIKSFYATFYSSQRDLQKEKITIANSEAVILGGQAGAGKSRTSFSCKKTV